MRRLLLFLVLQLSLISAYSQAYHCEIMNIIQPNNTTIDFDIYLYKTTSDTLLLGSFQGGINFNYAGLANGGTITAGFVPGSSWNPTTNSQLPPPQNAPFSNWFISPVSQQIRMTAAIVTSPLVAAEIPSTPPGLRIGTCRLTNTVPFSSCERPDFVWSFVTGASITKTAIAAFVNSATSQASLTTQTTFTYANQGPEHFVQSNPLINQVYNYSSITTLACGSFTWQGNTYTSSGVYADTVLNAFGCDSIYQLNLTIDTPTTTTYNQIACDSYYWTLSGQTYTTSGVYLHTVAQPSGCLHTDILNLTINNSGSNTATQFACNFYTWPKNGITYYNSGFYTSIGTNASGCPDTSYLALTVGHSNSLFDTIYNCNPIVWNGQNLVATGNYTHLSTNASGCDSTTYLYFELVPAISDTLTVHACGPYTAGSNTYTSSGTYFYQTTNPFGCVEDHLLYLTIGQNSYNTTTLTNCGSLYFNNTLYSTSGVFTTIMTNSSGCDSIITLSVTINPINTVAQFITTCDSYTLLGTTYYNSGTYYDTTSSSMGCDSIIKLNLTIKKSTSSYTSQAAVGSFTWPVSGLTYFTTGIYTWASTNSAGCPANDTLDLTINFPAGIQSNWNDEAALNLYPNPTSGTIHFDFESSNEHQAIVQISDLSGRVLQQASMQVTSGKNQWQFDISKLAQGMYQFDVILDNKLHIVKRKVIKSE